MGESDQQVTVDARAGRQVRFSVDDPEATQRRYFGFQVAFGKWSMSWSSFKRYPDRLFVVPSRQPGREFMIRNLWQGKSATPSFYDLVLHHAGGISDDPVLAAKRRDLVKVTATYRASGVTAKGRPLAAPRLGDALGDGEVVPAAAG